MNEIILASSGEYKILIIIDEMFQIVNGLDLYIDHTIQSMKS